VSTVAAVQTQSVTITGRCFGTGNAFSNEDNAYFAIIDNTYPARTYPAGATSWDACSNIIAFVGTDAVTCDVSSWTNTSITFSGFEGNYGENNWIVHSGDSLVVSVWNPQTKKGPATCSVRAGAPGPTQCHPYETTLLRPRPSSGPTSGGTKVTIRGSNLQDAAVVKFGNEDGTALVVQNSGKSLTVVAPAHPPGAVRVVVQTKIGNASQSTAVSVYTYKS
jgi:hypothetical protein